MSVNDEDEELPEEDLIELQGCGCPTDYHMADCPIMHPPTYDNAADYDGDETW